MVKRATSLFSSFGCNVTKQVARFLAARSTVALAPDACITIKIRLKWLRLLNYSGNYFGSIKPFPNIVQAENSSKNPTRSESDNGNELAGWKKNWLF